MVELRERITRGAKVLAPIADGRPNVLVETIDHVNIETEDVDRSAEFYSDVLGLESGDRPEFDRPGHWMYVASGQPVVHIIAPLPDNQLLTGSKDAAISHFAMRISDYEEARERLDACGIDYRMVQVPGSGRRQLFFPDPDGVLIELIHYPEQGT